MFRLALVPTCTSTLSLVCNKMHKQKPVRRHCASIAPMPPAGRETNPGHNFDFEYRPVFQSRKFAAHTGVFQRLQALTFLGVWASMEAKAPGRLDVNTQGKQESDC